MHPYDPELLDAATAPAVLDLADLAAARETERRLRAAAPAPDTRGVHIEDVGGVPGPPLRLYRPERRRSRGVVYDVHGGGFVLGSLETDHARNVALARELGTVVVSVDYRLAPEVPYPGPLDDVYRGLVWIAEHASGLGVDPDLLVLRGTSAGAGLGTAAALLARDRGGPGVAFQFLASPCLDDRLATRSATVFTDTPIWHRTNAEIGWSAYLGPGVPGSEGVSAYAAPARAADLAGLPPAYLSVMQMDPLRDEGLAYAGALLAAGVGVELHLFPGTFHGSARVVTAAVSRRELEEELTVLARVLGVGPDPQAP